MTYLDGSFHGLISKRKIHYLAKCTGGFKGKVHIDKGASLSMLILSLNHKQTIC